MRALPVLSALPLLSLLSLLPIASATLACGGPDYVETEDTRRRTRRERQNQFVGLEVRVLENGAEPREELRYQIEEGDREVAILGLQIGIQAGLGDPAALEGGAPAFFTIESGPVERIGERIRYDVELLRVEQGSHSAQIEQEIGTVHQIDGYLVVDERGITRDEHFDIPGGIPPRTATMLGNIFDSLEIIPLPEEPIGVGAIWEVRESVDVNAYTVQQVVVYKLLEREGDDMRLEVVVTQTAEPQPLRELPSGAEAMIEVFEGDGRGHASISLNRLVPHSELDFSTELEARTAGGQLFAMTTRTRIGIAPQEEAPQEDARPEGDGAEAAPEPAAKAAD